MPRQPHDVANINLRIRESLRRKLEREANRHRFSLNNEIRIRLEDSLNRDATRTLDDIANDMQLRWARLENRYNVLDLGDQLAAAVLSQAKAPEEVSNLARAWLGGRERGRRLTEGGAS